MGKLIHWPQKDGGTECFNKATYLPLNAKHMLNNASAPGQIRFNFSKVKPGAQWY